MSVYSGFEVNLENPNSTWTILFEYIDPGSKVLDVGCSSGYFDQVLIDQKDCVVDGIELDPKDAARASKVCRRVVVDNIETLDPKQHGLDNDYDYVIFADVLEHLVHPAESLKKVAKLLAPKGKIIFSIPNMANGAVRLQLLQGNLDAEKTGLLDATHLHFYTFSMVDKMIKDSGLFLNQIRYTTFDVPEKIAASALRTVGLENSHEFMEHLKSKDSVIYQFVGAISKQPPAKPVSLGRSVKSIKPRPLYEEELRAVQEDARQTFKNLVSANNRIEQLQKENEELKKKNEQLYKWSAVRAGKEVRKIIRGK